MRSRATDLLLLVLVNAIGFFSVHFCYFVGVKTGMLPIGDPSLPKEAIAKFFHVIVTTWMICAPFSLIALCFKGTIKYMLLLVPAVIPMAYGFKVLAFGW